MSETKHTPGPWRVRFHPANKDEFHVSTVTPPRHPYYGATKEVEIMSDEDYPTKLGDACLIAAAPMQHDLLVAMAACAGTYQPILEWAKKYDVDMEGARNQRIAVVRRAVLAAIAKAEGL